MFSVASGVATARQTSRLAGLARLESEARTLGVRAGLNVGVALREVARDIARARDVARSYANRWLMEARQNGMLGASSATRHWLERIATTESAEAFNSARAAGATRFFGMYRVWDAQLDKRTCVVCSNADGTIVPVNAQFPDGEPGAVHPRCRCSWTLLSATEAGKGGALFIAPV